MIRSKIVVGILPTFNLTNEENDPYKDQAKFVRMYADIIAKVGGIPLGLLESDITSYLPLCDAYIWPGGSKIEPSFYPVIQDAIKNKKPLLGICLGMQAITTFFNVLEDQKKNINLTWQEVYEKNKTENPYLVKLEDSSLHSHYVTRDIASIEKAKHKIKIEKNSFLYQIYQETEKNVVSLHGIVVARTPKSLFVSATSEDGVVEAVEYHQNGAKILGVEYHPEIVNDYAIFEWLILNAKIEYQVLINKDHEFHSIKPFQIVLGTTEAPDCKNTNMEKETYEAWQLLKKAVRNQGYYIDIESAYRTTHAQEEIYQEFAKTKGEDYANVYVAKPLHSEHESGLAVDFIIKIGTEWVNDFDERLQECYQYVASICADYGFILRYPEGKEDITGYSYEPWHLRYVGSTVLSHKLMKEKKTLEEYWASKEL